MYKSDKENVFFLMNHKVTCEAKYCCWHSFYKKHLNGMSTTSMVETMIVVSQVLYVVFPFRATFFLKMLN